MRTKPITPILLCLALILVAGTRTVDGGRFCAEPCDQIIRPGDPYPAYDPNWTKQDCDDYSFSGLNEYYGPDIGRNWGWIDNDKFDTSVEGADCSAYVGRCLALPGFMPENHRKGHQEATSFMYNNGLRDRDKVRRTHRVFPGGTVSQEMDRVEQWDFFVWNWNRNACGHSSNFGGHTGMIRTFSGSTWSTREAMNPSAGIRQTTRSRQQFIDRCTHFWRRNDWGDPSAPPVIVTQPRTRTNNIGDTAFFSVAATGTDLAYQWRLNGTPISGATESAFGFLVTGANSGGIYSVVITNNVGNVTSHGAFLMTPFANRSKLTQWDFNEPAYTGTGTTPPSIGSGTVQTVGSVTSDSSAPRDGSESDPAASGNYSRSINRPHASVPNKTAGIQFNAGTEGYENIVITFEQRVGSRASAYWRGQYTTNGVDWIDRIVVDLRAPFVQTGDTSFEFKRDDLSGVPGVADNPDFAYRIVAEHESTATGSGSAAYVPADPDDTYNATGNPLSRWDMVTVLGTVIPPPAPPPNQPPMLAPIGNHTVHAGSILAFTSVAFDPDPDDTLTFTLDPGAPPGAGIDPATGLFTWVTTDADRNTTALIAVRVTDDGEPPLSGTVAFSVSVLPRSRIEGISTDGNTMTLTWSAIPGVKYRIEYKESLSEPVWKALGSDIVADSETATAADTAFDGKSQRFYRITVVD